MFEGGGGIVTSKEEGGEEALIGGGGEGRVMTEAQGARVSPPVGQEAKRLVVVSGGETQLQAKKAARCERAVSDRTPSLSAPADRTESPTTQFQQDLQAAGGRHRSPHTPRDRSIAEPEREAIPADSHRRR